MCACVCVITAVNHRQRLSHQEPVNLWSPGAFEEPSHAEMNSLRNVQSWRGGERRDCTGLYWALSRAGLEFSLSLNS